jgi:hypothetical protein
LKKKKMDCFDDSAIYTREMSESETIDFYERVFSLQDYTGKADIFDLAYAGWSGTGKSNILECEFCLASVRDLDEEDEPIVLHKVISPNCSHAKKLHCRKFEPDEPDVESMITRCKLDYFPESENLFMDFEEANTRT